MKPLRSRKQLTVKTTLLAIAASLILLVCLLTFAWYFWPRNTSIETYKYVTTVAGKSGEIGEPFGVAVRAGDTYISDGQNGRIWRLNSTGLTVFASGLDTPSGIAFDKLGNLIVADSGTDSIRSVNAKGEVTTIAGIDNKIGSSDGDAAAATFNAPIGVAINADGKIFVADTYNDRIRVIENGKVTTIAGGEKGFSDGIGAAAKFDTPCGLAILQDKLLIADTGNGRIRVVEPDGRVWTLAGNGEDGFKDGLLLESAFYQPTAITVAQTGSIFVTDGNAIRQIGGTIPTVRTISSEERGIEDGPIHTSRFNRPSGLAIGPDGLLIVADSENRLVRLFTPTSTGHELTRQEIVAMRDKPEEFRMAQPARWPYDPPAAKRDIAGTLAEIRGEVKADDPDIHFHNGLDIAGAYGETARFVRDEKVLRPIAAENFNTLRELIRMPTMGYIHIRLGRNSAGAAFGDPRFEFETDVSGKMIGVRVPRGAKFKAGQPIGTLNPMNHVHLIAGRSGSEMNALDALILPGMSDSRPPTIEKVSLFDENWKEIETAPSNSRIKLTGKTRIVVRAYDQADGNSDRRRLGLYRLGYQILNADGGPRGETRWTIVFDRLPSTASINLVYANGSKSGATGETIFNYIVTNVVDGDEYREDFFNPAAAETGAYKLRVFAADYFGNVASRDIEFSR